MAIPAIAAAIYQRDPWIPPLSIGFALAVCYACAISVVVEYRRKQRH